MLADLFGLSPTVLGQPGSQPASQSKVPSGGSCRIYKITSPRSINPESDMTGWSHTGWVVVDEPGGYREVRTLREGRACKGRTGKILKPPLSHH